MAAKGSFNIFSKNYDEPNKHNAVQLFSMVCSTNLNQSQRPFTKETVSKRQNFGNEIRKQQKEQVKKNLRQKMLQTLQENDFFSMLESMAAKNSVQSKNFSNFLSDLKRSMNDYDFCHKIDQNKGIKQFLLDFYISSQQQLSLDEKSLLVKSLIFLTYYKLYSLEIWQKQQLNEMMIKQLQRIETWNSKQIEYFISMIDLMTNITADDDQNLNYYLMDTKIFPLISQKITQIQNSANKILKQEKDENIHKNYEDDLNNLRQSFISTLLNLSKYDNEFFFQYTVNEFVNDKNYLNLWGAKVINIFTNFFYIAKFRYNFFDNSALLSWFQAQIPTLSQKKFLNSQSIKTGIFEDIDMSSREKQLFYQFLCCLMVWLYKENDEGFLQQIKILIQNNLNGYCLSEFLIQSAGYIGNDSFKSRKNSVYVSKAIQMYEHLASDPKITLEELLVVTSGHTFQDVLKVFLEETYFTSCKISDLTLSVLNKMLSKDHRILKSLMQLRIIQSIDLFLSKHMQIQTGQQILNFFDLLTLMITSYDELPKEKNTHNQVARLLENNGLIKKIQRYQNHEEKVVQDKVEAFLNYFDTVRQGNFNHQSLEI